MSSPFALRAAMLLAVILLSACSPRHPLGISDEEWKVMSVEQRLQAREKQAELARAAAERRAAEARLREAEAQRQILELEARRSEAGEGERVQCVLSSSEAFLAREWRQVEPLALDLVTGMELVYRIAEQDSSRRSTNLYASFDGQTVSLCRSSLSASSSARCARLLGTQLEYRRGLREHVAAEEFLRGHLRCNLVR